LDFAQLLERYQKADLLRFVTAGSVDAGKSTLIGRLLHDTRSLADDRVSSVRKASVRKGLADIDYSFFADGLKAEREQGITIDVAYLHFSSPDRRFIIADAPGHEQYTRNMATGASTADLALIIVDALQGVVEQTKRHARIASLLGVQRLAVAVNKMDLAGYKKETFESVTRGFASFAGDLEFSGVVFIPTCALLGENLVERSENMPWYEGQTLLKHLETVPAAPDLNMTDFRFPVQCVLRPDASFRGLAGRIASGKVRAGDEVLVLPQRMATRVKRILTPDGDADAAFAPQSVTICIDREIDVGRGQMLVHPGRLPSVGREIDAMLVWMDEQPMDPDRPYLLKQTTRWVKATVEKVRYRVDLADSSETPAARLEMNDIGCARLNLFQEIMFDEYRRNRRTGSFILVDPITNQTACMGMIIEGMSQRSPAEGQPSCGPATIWLTGLSGAGKTTLARALEKRLAACGHAVCVLDGDDIRKGLNKDLGFSREDRRENIRRVAEVARILNDAGVMVIASFISPYREDRAAARLVIGPGRYIETFVDAPLAICERRDSRGVYRKARAGEIPEFTGVSSPYEPPDAPVLHFQSDRLSVEEEVDLAIRCLVDRGLLRLS
jgi:bifunctional enzyme CysN/CysC